MSAAELLKKVEALSPAERRKFLKAVAALEEPAKTVRQRPRGKKVDWSGAEERARQITGNRIIPNMVLLERDERGF